MPWTSLDHALLNEDVAAEVTAQNLDTLSPAQLAIAAGRDDLGFLTKFRAGMDFRDRYCSFWQACASEKGDTVHDPSGGLFFAPLEFALPKKLDEYTPTMLVLLPFNRCYGNNDLVKEAAARFRDLALTHQTRGPTPSLPSTSPSPAPTPGPEMFDAATSDNPKDHDTEDPSLSPAPELASSLPALLQGAPPPRSKFSRRATRGEELVALVSPVTGRQ